MSTPHDILARLPEAICKRAEKEAQDAYDSRTDAFQAEAARDAVLARYAAAADEADRAAEKARQRKSDDHHTRKTLSREAAARAAYQDGEVARAAFWAAWEKRGEAARVTAEELAEVARQADEGDGGFLVRLTAEVTALRAEQHALKLDVRDMSRLAIERHEELASAQMKLEMLRETARAVCDVLDAAAFGEARSGALARLALAHDALRAVLEGAPVEVTTSHTRAQFAAAVDKAHDHLHARTLAFQDDNPVAAAMHLEHAHDALHRVGAGKPRIACATPDPEAQRLYADIISMRDREIPCGHTVADLIGSTEKGPDGKDRPSITQCGQCLADRQPEIIEANRKRARNAARRRHLEEQDVDRCHATLTEAGIGGGTLFERIEDLLEELTRLRGERPLNAPPEV